MRVSGCVGVGVAVFLAWLSVAPAAAQAPAVVLDPIFGIGGTPTTITHAGDGSGRVFVATQAGTIQVYDGTTVSAFLTVPNVVAVDEAGLLGLAFHPDFR